MSCNFFPLLDLSLILFQVSCSVEFPLLFTFLLLLSYCYYSNVNTNFLFSFCRNIVYNISLKDLTEFTDQVRNFMRSVGRVTVSYVECFITFFRSLSVNEPAVRLSFLFKSYFASR